jgi:hypothetical protein
MALPKLHIALLPHETLYNGTLCNETLCNETF